MGDTDFKELLGPPATGRREEEPGAPGVDSCAGGGAL